jgi:hypothetical protein
LPLTPHHKRSNGGEPLLLSGGVTRKINENKKDPGFRYAAGLPDFSWYNVPKLEKYTK